MRSQSSVRPARTLGAVLLVMGFAVSTPAMAQNLVTNGSFQVTGGSTSFQFGTYGPYTPTETLSGWSSPGGYNYVFLPTSTSATGYYGALSLYSNTTSPSTTFNNASPTGGNFIAADSDYGAAAITQTISGLTTGKTYAVSFAWAGTEQTNFSGASQADWQVSLGSSTQTTQIVNVASQGFSGWMNSTFKFVATSSSEVLSFLAQNPLGGGNVPSFALLANITVTPAPEPFSSAILATGLAGLAAVSLRRRRRAI